MALPREGRVGNALRAAKELLRSPSHSAFVDAAYRALLWREPDDLGRRGCVGDLRRGRRSRFKVLRDISQSPEAAKHMMFGPGFREHVQAFTVNGTNVGVDVPPILFLHPMKCGGTALAQGLSKLADPWPRILDVWVDQLVCFPRPMLARVKLLTGHLPYGAVEVLPPNTKTLTVVREPVSRTLSHFTHLRTHGGQVDLTLETFVRDEAWRRHWVDYQARQLAAEVPVGAAWQGEWSVRLQDAIDGCAPPFDELRQRALDRLAAVDIVGVNDDLHAVVRAVAAVWGKPPPPAVERENTSLAPLRRSDVEPDLIAEIEADTRADADLYAAARARAAELPGSGGT